MRYKRDVSIGHSLLVLILVHNSYLVSLILTFTGWSLDCAHDWGVYIIMCILTDYKYYDTITASLLRLQLVTSLSRNMLLYWVLKCLCCQGALGGDQCLPDMRCPQVGETVELQTSTQKDEKEGSNSKEIKGKHNNCTSTIYYNCTSTVFDYCQ